MPTKTAEDYLEALAEELTISEARYEQASRSYSSLGNWLGRPESTVSRFDPQIYPQGSFRLGTAIRPLNEAEEYDVDSVCVLQNLTTSELTQRDLKRLVELEVRSYHRSQNMVKPVREGNRCWVLSYADQAQFHMDIVPALTNSEQHRLLLERHGIDNKWSDTAMVITDRRSENYNQISSNWQRSNPKGYAEWFKQRMGALFEQRRRALAEAARASVESIPVYKVRTPLQSAIMILKRHRDGMFEGRYDERPISIIITTLAAHSYEGEATIADALYSILSRMDNFIEMRGNYCIVRNPSDPFENFADKWPLYPERQAAFFEWLAQARHDFGEIARQIERRRLVEIVQPRMGVIAERAAMRLGPPPVSMLRAGAVAAIAQTEPAFSGSRREPTTPRGFA